MKLILPIIIILIAGGIFFWLSDPILNAPLTVDATTGNLKGGVFPLLSERRDLNTALENSNKLREASQELVDRYNELADSDKAGIDRLLPDRVDNVQLVIDINSIADKYGMTIKNVKIRTDEEVTTARTTTRAATTRRSTNSTAEKRAYISFTVTGNYNQLRNFLTDLARSLRLVDVTELSFTAGDQDLYQFNVELRTYWLE